MHKKRKKEKVSLLKKKSRGLVFVQLKERIDYKWSKFGSKQFMKSSNIAQEKTQAPYPDEMQDLNGQKLKKNPRKSRFLCKIICQ